MAATEGGRQRDAAVAAASGGAGESSPADSSKPTAAPSWKGRHIKRFRLVDELGEGAMGKVFVAEDTILRRHIAMKLLPSKHRDGRPNHRTERLITEARSAATLEHPNVVTIHEIDQSGGVHYIAMELIEGGNLERLVQMSGPMEVERACQLIAEAAEALAHAHSRGIVHRDVKPANLLLTRSGRCKVCDFGLAMVETPEGDATKMRCVGTPYFISPEIAMGKGATPLSDIYSLGCTLFFLLTGRPPFPGTSSRQVLKMHVNDPLPDLRRWRNDVPDRLIAALEQACAKDPSKRFSDAERFAKVLRTFTIATPSASAGSSGGLAGLTGVTVPPVHVTVPPHLSGMFGSSGHLQPVSAQTATVAAPALSQAQLQALGPAISQAQSQVMSSPMIQPAPSKFNRPLVWAGAATVATAALIALGMWLVRPGSDKSQPSAVPPPAPLAVSQTKAPPTPTPAFAPSPSPTETSDPTSTNVLAGNVLLNGTMETLDKDGAAASWYIPKQYKSQVQVLEEKGNRFVRLTNDDATKQCYVEQKIKVDPAWKTINVSARMRATNYTRGKGSLQDARVAVAFRDEDNNHVGSWPPVPSLRTDCDWTQRVSTADVPPGAKTVCIELAIFNSSGTVDFDDVAVVPQK